MKQTIKWMLMPAVLAVLCCAAVMPARAVRTDEVNDVSQRGVYVLDSLLYDGQRLEFTYTVDSRCNRLEHDAQLDYDLETYRDRVLKMRLYVTDSAPENHCGGPVRQIEVSGSLDIASWLNREIQALEAQRYVMDQDFVLEMPPLRPMGFGAGTNFGQTPPETDTGTTPSTGMADLPETIPVTIVTYEPTYSCTLYKNDGARDDGFTGTGSNLEDARREAGRACTRTNHPDCMSFAYDPVHTTCDAELVAVENVKQYDSDDLPEGSYIDSWSCTLYKNDGARKDGFTGNGETIDDARASAANGCKRTNHPLCEDFSLDSEHTSCMPAVRFENAKPIARWTCTLWKNDGSRKDGFTGTGETEEEARRDSTRGCRTTNNPYCDQYSMNPDHTQCTVEFVEQ